MILPVLQDLRIRGDLTGEIVISDASTVIEEATSKGTARADPEDVTGQEIDIEMTEDEDLEAEIDLLEDLQEMTRDLITEAEST